MDKDVFVKRIQNKFKKDMFKDAIHYKVREESKIKNKAAYVILGVNKDGFKSAYKAVNEAEALSSLDFLEEKWGKK